MRQVLSPAPGPNHAGTFRCTWLSSGYAVTAVRVPAWMAWWQGTQTMSVFRRFLAMRGAHAGWGPAG